MSSNKGAIFAAFFCILAVLATICWIQAEGAADKIREARKNLERLLENQYEAPPRYKDLP